MAGPIKKQATRVGRVKGQDGPREGFFFKKLTNKKFIYFVVF